MGEHLAQKSDDYVLYYNPYSICSLMVRCTLALRGEPKDPTSAMSVETKVVDIFHEEQLSENFLCEINPEGQASHSHKSKDINAKHARFRC
jgi:hypothetical protein